MGFWEVFANGNGEVVGKTQTFLNGKSMNKRIFEARVEIEVFGTSLIWKIKGILEEKTNDGIFWLLELLEQI